MDRLRVDQEEQTMLETVSLQESDRPHHLTHLANGEVGTGQQCFDLLDDKIVLQGPQRSIPDPYVLAGSPSHYPETSSS